MTARRVWDGMGNRPTTAGWREAGDLTTGSLLVALAAFGLRALARHPSLTEFDFGTDPGPVLLPRLLLSSLGVGGGLLAVHGLWKLIRAGRRSLSFPLQLRQVLLPAAFALSLGGYVAVLKPVGFRLATAVFATLWVLLLTRQMGGRWSVRMVATMVAVGVGITAAVYYVLQGFVKVPLP